MPTDLQDVNIVGLSLFLAAPLIALVMRWSVQTTENRIRLLTLVLCYLSLAAVFGLQGFSTVSGTMTIVGRVINFARYWAYVPALTFFSVFFSLSMFRSLGMALTLGVGAFCMTLSLACASWGIDISVWYLAIPAMVLAGVMIVGVWLFYTQTEAEAARVHTNMHGAMKVLWTVFIFTFILFYIIDTPWLDSIKDDLVLMASLDLGRDVLGFIVVGLVLLIFVDYYENASGIGAIFSGPSKGFPRFAPLNENSCASSTPLPSGPSPSGNVPATTGAKNNLSLYPFGQMA
jgi:hypothetical protein